MKRKAAAILLLLLATGCSMSHSARVEGTIITHRELLTRPYEEIGLVHAETWGGTIYWRLSAASLQKAAAEALIKEARKHGADAIVDIDVRVENHYSGIIPIALLTFIYGWEECHATGTAIKFKN
jgi:uncharacterized protein YbjQ (UPF0145 family)